MLDIKYVRENPEAVQAAAKNKRVKIDVGELLKLDELARGIQKELDTVRAEQKRKSKEARGESEELKTLKEKVKELEARHGEAATKLAEILLLVPNVPLDDVPVGKDETENVVAREVGEKTKFDFEPKDYLTLGERLGIIDVKTAAEVSGTRFGYLKGDAAAMEFALVQYALSVLGNEDVLRAIAKEAGLGDASAKPFVPVVPPVMIKPEVFQKMARLEPKDDRYYIPTDDLYLVGSAEHTLGAMHMDQVLEERELPVRYVGFSTAFRREAGSYGKDTKGILRVHQFDKLEIESFCAPESSRTEQEFIVACQEHLMKSLGIPYQVIMICTGDMGGPDARQIDLNSWMPGQGTYRETHTCDLMTDYQARRLNTRLKRGGAMAYVHMVDATVFAIGRTLIAIMENYQQADGSIRVPEALQPYLGGKQVIGA